MSKAEAANPDGLVLAAEDVPAANLVREAAKQGLKLPLIGDVPLVTDQYVRLAEKAAEGTYAPTDFWMSNPYPGVKRFVAAFKN